MDHESLNARSAWLLILALLFVSGCPREPVAPEGACDESNLCQDGWLCVDGSCAKACNRNRDCPRRDQACTNGTCVRVSEPACDEDADCTTPRDCQLPDGAACRAGACVYASRLQGEDCDDEDLCTDDDACDGEGSCVGQRKACATRPAAECVDGDGVYRSYADRGVCLPASGECSYAPYDVACERCTSTCLVSCAGLRCDEYQGGCRANGRCVPGTAARCEFDLADDGTACDLATEPPGSQGGQCADSACSGCSVDADCTEPPGDDPECFAGSCESAGCTYTPRPGESCGQPTCRSGYAYPFPLCDNDGVCLAGNRVSCNGLRCNAEGTACLPRCGGDADCMPGAFCNLQSGVCEGLLDDGEDCLAAGSTQCLSGYCDGLRCCAGGDCCNLAADCPDSYAATSSCHDVTLTTSCQGSRRERSCVEHVCGSATVDDDSGCAGLSHACPDHLAAVSCSPAAAQPAPTCPSACSATALCEEGYQCSSGLCLPIPGVGDTCTGSGTGTCNSGLKCEHGVCCVATGGTCCTASTDCAAGLACNLAISSCAVGCADYTTSACAEPVATVCMGNTCVAKLADGVSCADATQCVHGACVDGVCCDAACTGTCEACRGSLTGRADGVCAPVLVGLNDLAPIALCAATGTGCSASSCACDGARACKRAVGQACTQAGDCARNVCECADEQCAGRTCAVQACPVCQFTTNGSLCASGLGDSAPVDDVGECVGDRSCYAGLCKGDDGRTCGTDADCGHGHCECGDPSCASASRKCAANDCASCEYTVSGAACDGELTNGTPCADGNACTQTDTCQGGGCVGANPVVCPPGRGCETSPGTCSPASGACTYGVAVVNTVCRAVASGGCDLAEVCDGNARDCPIDSFRPSTYPCHPTQGDCDPEERCPGTGPTCPPDQKSTAVCRPQTGDCDIADSCDGVNGTCPTLDRVRPGDYPCRSASGLCDLDDTCDGTTKTCDDDVKGSGTPCRAKTGVCDREDLCNGSSKTCADAVEPTTTVCRSAVHPVCDTAENCSGGKDCPNDVVAGWHSDCGVCDWCESGQCVANSSEHGECTFCEKCASGSCIAAAAGEDPRGDDCPLLVCGDYVYGWSSSGLQCLRYASSTTSNGTCNGNRACQGPTTVCAGAGAVLATCGEVACVKACQTGANATGYDSVAEVCFTDYAEHGCGYQWACDAGGYCVYTGSCPVLYAWDGGGFAFESDIYPSGKLGLKMAYGFRKPYPHDAYLLRSAPQEIEPGALELRLVEERHETDYLDQAILYAVDVPEGLDLFSSLVNVPGPYLSPTALLHTVSAALSPPAGATLLGDARDIRPIIAASDHDALMLSEDNNHCAWNTLELDLGELDGAPQIKLIIDAKTVFPTSVEGYAWKNALDPTGLSTRLEVLDAQGAWVEVPREVATLARPKEFPRPGVTDLSRIFLTGQYRVRISYLMKTYVDAIWLDTTQDQPVTAFEVPTVSAVLDYYGYSAQSNPSDDFEFVYGLLTDRDVPLFPGAYTRYGEVTALLANVDDMFAIFGNGDQITLRFPTPPPPAPGYHRRYLLYSNGYYKSAKNADIAHLVAPLPFAAMSNFPYDEQVERYPDDAVHLDYLSTWNTRVEVP